MLQNKKPIGGVLMAAVLLMGMMSHSSFMEAANRVTITKAMLRSKHVTYRLYVEGEEHELLPGIYDNAILLAKEDYETASMETNLGRVEGEQQSHYALYVDA